MAIAAPIVSWIVCIHTLDYDCGVGAVSSCLDQTYVDQEVIVICNGKNREQIKENLNAYFGSNERLKIISSPIRGLGGNLAYGVSLACGDFIARIDADDTCPNDRISRQVSLLNVNRSAHLVSSTKKNIVNMKKVDLDSFALRNVVIHPSVLVRKSSILRVGNYAPVFGAEDYDLWVRILGELGGYFILTNDKFVNYSNYGVSGFRGHYRAYLGVLQVQIRTFFVNFRFVWALGIGLSLVRLLYLKIRGFVVCKTS